MYVCQSKATDQACFLFAWPIWTISLVYKSIFSPKRWWEWVSSKDVLSYGVYACVCLTHNLLLRGLRDKKGPCSNLSPEGFWRAIIWNVVTVPCCEEKQGKKMLPQSSCLIWSCLNKSVQGCIPTGFHCRLIHTAASGIMSLVEALDSKSLSPLCTRNLMRGYMVACRGGAWGDRKCSQPSTRGTAGVKQRPKT